MSYITHTISVCAFGFIVFLLWIGRKGKWDPRVGGFFPSSGGTSKLRPAHFYFSPSEPDVKQELLHRSFYCGWWAQTSFPSVWLQPRSRHSSCIPQTLALHVICFPSLPLLFSVFMDNLLLWLLYQFELWHWSLFLIPRDAAILSVSSVFFCFLRENDFKDNFLARITYHTWF